MSERGNGYQIMLGSDKTMEAIVKEDLLCYIDNQESNTEVDTLLTSEREKQLKGSALSQM